MAQDKHQRAKERIFELVSYEAGTGALIRLLPGGNGVRAGDVAGGLDKSGYLKVCVGGKSYWAHRVAWLLAHGEWPTGHIDHINGNKSDNRLENLRDVSAQVNTQNVRKARGTSGSGLLGSYFDKRRNRWFASIVLDGKHKFLGYHATAEGAHLAYMAAKPKYHEGFVA